MCFSKRIGVIIRNRINSVVTDDWNEAREQIVDNLLKINLSELIDNYKPCVDVLYMPEKELKNIIEKSLFQLSNFFIKVSDEIYEPKEYILKEEIDRVVKIGILIMQKKQRNLYININFSTYLDPKSFDDMSEKDIEKLEKFIKKDKFNIVNSNGLSISLNTTHLNLGLNEYRSILNEPGPVYRLFATPRSNLHLFSLYKSINGKIYMLISSIDRFNDLISCNYYISSYRLIEDENWFY